MTPDACKTFTSTTSRFRSRSSKSWTAFKKGNDDLNFQARSFLRRVDELTGDVLSAEGTSLGDGLGSIRVVLEADQGERMKDMRF